MNDFLRDPPLTVSRDRPLDGVCDDMFRLGVRAFLVVRDSTVIGLITADDLRGPRAQRWLRRAATLSGQPASLRVADVMTPSAEVPAIDWDTLQESRVADLLEIFEATGLHHLIVLQNLAAKLSTVRGLIHRSRIERRLSVPTAGSALSS